MKRKNRRYKKVSVLKRKSIRLVVIFLALVGLITVFIFQKTGAIYETITDSEASLDIAFYCIDEDFQTMTLSLDNIIPRTSPYVYNFSVSNNNGTKRTETELTYDLLIRTTTNLPLNVSLYDTNNNPVLIGSETIAVDDDGTYFRYIDIPQRDFGFINNQTDNYRIQVVLPVIYSLEEYQDIIELIEINVDSKQKL